MRTWADNRGRCRKMTDGIMAAPDPHELAKERLDPDAQAKVTLLRTLKACHELGMTYRMPSVEAAMKCPHVSYLELRGLIHRNDRTLRIAQ